MAAWIRTKNIHFLKEATSPLTEILLFLSIIDHFQAIIFYLFFLLVRPLKKNPFLCVTSL